MAEARNSPDTAPVVLWQTGGPGCSSLLASFTENGPCLVPEKGPNAGKAVFNEYAWNTNATMIWLDQPAGVGFSWGTENDKDEADAARDAYDFLQAFFKAHPTLQTRDFFVVGESYGGHYSPALSYAIFSNNNNLPAGAVKINLKGLGVGNGLTVPLAQYPKYAELAYNFTKEKIGHSVISLQTYEAMQANLKTCLPLIESCQNNTATCGLAQSLCNEGQIGPYGALALLYHAL
jgi:cathepsin A (carboxypeptidase C)